MQVTPGGLRAEGTQQDGPECLPQAPGARPTMGCRVLGAAEPHTGGWSGEAGGIGAGQDGSPRLGSSSRVPDPGATPTWGTDSVSAHTPCLEPNSEGRWTREGRAGRTQPGRHPVRRGTPLAGEGHPRLAPAPRPPACPLPGPGVRTPKPFLPGTARPGLGPDASRPRRAAGRGSRQLRPRNINSMETAIRIIFHHE